MSAEGDDTHEYDEHSGAVVYQNTKGFFYT